MPRGPSYTAEELDLMTKLAKDKSLSHADKVSTFFSTIGPSNRTADAISQKIRKLEGEKKNANVKPAKAAAPAAPAKRGPGRPPKAKPAVVEAAKPVNGNGHKNGNGNGHKTVTGEVEVALNGVTIRGSAAKVGALLTQLSA